MGWNLKNAYYLGKRGKNKYADGEERIQLRSGQESCLYKLGDKDKGLIRLLDGFKSQAQEFGTLPVVKKELLIPSKNMENFVCFHLVSF